MTAPIVAAVLAAQTAIHQACHDSRRTGMHADDLLATVAERDAAVARMSAVLDAAQAVVDSYRGQDDLSRILDAIRALAEVMP